MLGLLAVATLPVAVVATRYSASYDLVHAGFSIPVALALGIGAIVLARRARRVAALAVTRPESGGRARVGRGLGIAGIAIAASGTVALVVYGVLTYLGEHG